MAIKRLYPLQDAFIAQGLKQNTGRDEILEIGYCNRDGVEGPARTLIEFDGELIGQTVKDVDNFKATLCLYSARHSRIPAEYSLEFFRVLEDWTEGLGRVTDDCPWTLGVSWENRNEKDSWNVPGGTLDSEPFRVVSFGRSSLDRDIDLKVDVTDMVKEGKLGSILIKLSNESENYLNGTHISFFSSNTHTIFRPYLEITYDNSKRDSELEELDENFKINITNLQDSYILGERTKLRVGVKPEYPKRLISTSSLYLEKYILPENSYWGIRDRYTSNMLVDFSDGTKISADNSGSYFILDTEILTTERYLDIVLKVVGEDTQRLVDTGATFKVKRLCQI